MDKKTAAKAVFHGILAILPGALGAAARTAEEKIIGASGKAQTVIATAGQALKLTRVVNDEVLNSPKVQTALKVLNDALISVANAAQEEADAQTVIGDGTGVR